MSIQSKAALSKAGIDAKNLLRERKVASKTPASMQEQLRMQQETEQKQSQWTNSVTQYVKGVSEVSFEGKEGSDPYKFPVPQETLAPVRDMAVNYMLQSGLDPQSPESKQYLQDFVDRAIFFYHGNDIIKNITHHIYASVSEQISAQDAGVRSPNNVSAPNYQAPQRGQGRSLADIRKEGFLRR
jgi:Ca2+-dependent lipid-binding protein